MIFGLLALNFADEQGLTPASTNLSFVRDIAVVPPCGACRENLLDYDAEAFVIVETGSGLRKLPVRALLPMPYRG